MLLIYQSIPSFSSDHSIIMKNIFLQQKFKNNFVKPLYRRVKSSKVKPKKLFVSVDDDNSTKLCGNGIYVKRKSFSTKNVDFDLLSVKHRNIGYKSIPGFCENNVRDFNIDTTTDEVCNIVAKNSVLNHNMLSTIDEIQENKDKSIQADKAATVIQKVPDKWLRVYPASESAGETIFSIIVRCILCQLGLATFLVLWTSIWVFVIQYFEGPFEMEVSKDFEKQQNQLVIDLATELRQITPLSSAWRHAIERRIRDERMLTMQAVAKGAKHLPGRYWDLSGTFLFTIYVMTTLGFGAPVPQTMWGRMSALIYAVLAIPTHIYLMVNASTFAVVSVASRIRRLQTKRINRNIDDEEIYRNRKDSPNSNRNSKLIRTTNKTLRQKLFCVIQVVSAGRFVPLAAILYYTVGLIIFGLLRNKSGTELTMFPLQFTTSGGLEQVEFHVRVMYGFYVEGAMILLACTLATIRRHGSSTASSLAEHFRLFESEEIK